VNVVPKLRFKNFDEAWVPKRISEISDIVTDGTHFSPTTFDSGEYKYITSKNIRMGRMKLDDISFLSEEDHRKIYATCPVEYGDILLTKDGASTGNICLNELEEEFSLLSSVALIKTNKNQALNSFVYFYFVSPYGAKQVSQSVAGQAITRITLTNLNKYKFNIPSLPEQKKIADFLGAVDEKLRLLRVRHQSLTEYKKGVMQKIFTQDLRFKADDGSDFPDWENFQLGSLVSISNAKSKIEYKVDDGKYFIVDMGSITRDGKLAVSKQTNCSDDLLSVGQLIMPKDDIGGGLIIGRVAFIDQNHKYCLSDHVYALTVKDVISKFLNYRINSYEVNKAFRRKANGTAQLGIGKKTVSEQEMMCPDSKEEQQKIADFLSAIDDKISAVASQITQMQDFKKGLLQQMFV